MILFDLRHSAALDNYPLLTHITELPWPTYHQRLGNAFI